MVGLVVNGHLLPVHLAEGFIARLLGVWAYRGRAPVLLMHCRSVHSFGLRRPLSLVFLDRQFRVVALHDGFQPWRVAVCPQAAHVLESVAPIDVRLGDRVTLLRDQALGLPEPACLRNAIMGQGHGQPKGVALVEIMLAIPVVLFFCFAVVQIGLLWHAKYALTHAVHVAARHASVHHGSDSAIRDGLVNGLLPLVGKADSLSGMTHAMFRSAAEITQGLAMGWIRWEVLSPTRQSFLDWGRPADPLLSPGASAQEIEIPATGLMGLAPRRQPASGVAQRVGGLPVGTASGQTLVDANNLKVHLRVGVPLQMPVAGRFLARGLAWWSGCGWSLAPTTDRLGLTRFGPGVQASALSMSMECRALAARDAKGHWRPRWPMEASAVIQMQSNARRSVMVLHDRQQKSATQK